MNLVGTDTSVRSPNMLASDRLLNSIVIEIEGKSKNQIQEALFIRCGRVITDFLAYPKFRKNF